MVKFRKLFGSSEQKELQEKASKNVKIRRLGKNRETQNDLVIETQNALNEKQNELEAKSSELGSLYEQNEDVIDFKGDRKKLQEQIAETEKKHAVLKEEVATLTKRLSNLKTDLGKIETAIEKAGGPKSTAVLGDKAHLSPLLKAYTEQFGEKYGKPEETTLNGQKVTVLKFGSKDEAMQFFEAQAKAGHSFKLLDAAGNVTHEAKSGKFTEVKATSMKPVNSTPGTRSEPAPKGYDSSSSDSRTPSSEPAVPSSSRRGPSLMGGDD